MALHGFGHLARKLRKGKRVVRDVADIVTQPRRGRQADKDRASVRLARETRGVAINPQDAARGDTFSRSVVNARQRTRELKELVRKRKLRLR